VLRAKLARVHEPHVAPVNRFVEALTCERGAPVPYVDPESGGVAARVLMVLETPSRRGALRSGMVSMDNDDATARNLWLAHRDTGTPRGTGLLWNAVPWYVGSERRNAAVTRADEAEGAEVLLRLLDLLKEVRVVLPFGRPAGRCVATVGAELAGRGVGVVPSIHPSPNNYAARPHARAEVEAALVRARERGTT
jgi:uracil-DNA glycosylase